MTAEDHNSKVGLGAEQWIEMWEGWMKHDEGQHGEGDCHHEEGEGDSCNDTDTEIDQEGNQIRVAKVLKNNLHHLTGGKTDVTFLVSLCGNSPDMEWLSSKGYDVVGLELSEAAVKSAFEKVEFNKSAKPIPYEVTVDGNLKIYSATDGKKMKVYVANFFDDVLTPEKIGTFDCIWDSHGIVSIPVPQQEPFAKKLITFLKPGGKMMFSTIAYDIEKLKKGPAPSPIPASTLQQLYPDRQVELLESTLSPAHEAEGLDEWTQVVTLIS